MRVSTALRTGVGAVGLAMIAFGAWTFWRERDHIGVPASIGRWLLGGVIGHDAILAPVVFLGCALAGRFTGARVRRALALFLLAGGSLVIVGLPDILRSGDNPNPTVTPLDMDYPRNLMIALSAVGLIAVLTVVPGGVRDRRRRAREARLSVLAQAASARAEEEAMARSAAGAAGATRATEPEVGTETVSQDEAEAEPQTEPETEPETEPQTEPEAEALPAPRRTSTEQDGDPEDG